jgi:transketolase N-terminal domain/subunit
MSSKATYLPLSLAEFRELGQHVRVDSNRASDVKKSAHPTSSMSAADLMAVLCARAELLVAASIDAATIANAARRMALKAPGESRPAA